MNGWSMTAGAGAVPGQIFVEFEHFYTDSGQEYAILTGADMDGTVIWTYETDRYECAQLDHVVEIGCHENGYYFCEGGAIKCLDLATGILLWENDDFDGSVSDWTFDTEGNLYACGYLGPDLLVVTADGETAKYIGMANEEFYWPYDMNWYDDTTLEITYEGGGMDQEQPESLLIDVSDVRGNSFARDSSDDDSELIIIDTDASDIDFSAQCMLDGDLYFVVNCKESITLRTSPSVYAAEICQIPLGSAVSYLGYEENGFYYIQYNGQTGYSLASYLSTEYSTAYSTYWVVNCNQSITLRKIPSVDGPEICQMPLGAAVTFISRADNGFYCVEYNGQTGYALASYLSADAYYGGYNANTRCQVVNCRESITLRTSPSVYASEICQMPLGMYVDYLGFAGNGFYKVEYNGMIGYALASYLMFV